MEWLPVLAAVPYLLFILWILKNLWKQKVFNPSASALTYITVIIPCHNEERNIPALLGDICSQDYPSEKLEVIVVDDNSTDRTSEFVQQFIHIDRVRLIRNRGTGKKSAIKTAVSEAKGDLIVTTDADCRMNSNWLSTIESYFASENPSLIIGPVTIASTHGLTGIFQEMEFLALQGVTAGTAAGGSAVLCNGANLAFTKKIYIDNLCNLRQDIAGGDDIFLLHGVKKQNNKRIRWIESESAIVETSPARDGFSLLKQRSRWISKSLYYNDAFTIFAGIVTFVTLLIQAALSVIAVINPTFTGTLFVFLILKSTPDFLLIQNRARCYRKSFSTGLFILFQLVYPFYVIAVLSGLRLGQEKKLSSPFQRGI